MRCCAARRSSADTSRVLSRPSASCAIRAGIDVKADHRADFAEFRGQRQADISQTDDRNFEIVQRVEGHRFCPLFPVIVSKPGHKLCDPVAVIRLRPVPCQPLQQVRIGPCGGHIPRLHVHVIALCFAAQAVFDGFNEIQQTHFVGIADVDHAVGGHRRQAVPFGNVFGAVRAVRVPHPSAAGCRAPDHRHR